MVLRDVRTRRMAGGRNRGRGPGRRKALRTQREILCDVMLSAGECATHAGDSGQAWLTLEELARLTQFGEASISAQLRHLRKPWNGGYVVEKRRREAESWARPEQAGALWEYRLQPQRELGGAA
jgi:hypothetical protein